MGASSCEQNQGQRIVLDLVRGLKGRNVTMNNFFFISSGPGVFIKKYHNDWNYEKKSTTSTKSSNIQKIYVIQINICIHKKHTIL